MREFLRVLGAALIALFLFYAFVFVNFYVSQDDPQLALAFEKYSLMVALREYQKEKGGYPILPDSPIGDVKRHLVKLGYLPPGPDVDKDARYFSADGGSYGLLFHINRGPIRPQGTRCLIEVDAMATGWWVQPPKCPF